MSDLSTVPSNVLYYTGLELSERGVDLKSLPQWRSVIRPLLEMKHPRIAFAQSVFLIEQALGKSNDETLGLAVGARQKFATTGLLSAGLLASTTCKDALRFGIKYHRLAGSMMDLHMSESTEGEMILKAVSRDPKSQINTFLIQEVFANLAQMARFLCQTAAPFKQVDVIFEPSDPKPYQQTFGTTPIFNSPENRIVFSKAIAEKPLDTADAYVLNSITPILDQLIALEGANQSLVAHVESLIVQSLPNVPTMQDIARQTQMSERSLRRRLENAGTSFRDILDQVRQTRALEMILQSNLPMQTIASVLGFEDDRSLRRRLQSWTGMSATKLRADQTQAE